MEYENGQQSAAKLDLNILLHDCLMMVRRFWGAAVVLALVLSGMFCLKAKLNYRPLYRAEATCTVYVSNPMQSEVRGYNTETAEQMAKTFPYILTSGALKEMVMRDLNIPGLPPISAEVLSNTNIFSLSVQAPNPEMAYNVLNSVIENYPAVAEFVVGPTTMSLLDESGLPDTPSNSVNYVRALEKGVVLSLGLWLLVILGMAMARSTIHNEDELKRVINLRCMGVLPLIKGMRRENNRTCPVVSGDGRYREFSESVRLMRMRVEKEMESQNAKVLLITSATPSEGKTTVAINMATALALKGKRILLVDCDLRNPSVAQNLGIENKNGLVDLIEGRITADKAVKVTDTENFDLVVAGGPVGQASELLSQSASQEFLAECREKYDYVILDTPPASLLADASEIAVAADAALLVIRQNYAPKSQIMEGARLMAESGLYMVGCVMNHSSRSALNDKGGYYGYGYGYGSYGHYGHYGNHESGHGESSDHSGRSRRKH